MAGSGLGGGCGGGGIKDVCQVAVRFLHEVCLSRFSLTLRRLMSYIYGAPILDVSRSHTTTQHSR